MNTAQLNRCIGHTLTATRRANRAGNFSLHLTLAGAVRNLNRARIALRRGEGDHIAAVYATTASCMLASARHFNR